MRGFVFCGIDLVSAHGAVDLAFFFRAARAYLRMNSLHVVFAFTNRQACVALNTAEVEFFALGVVN